LLMLQRVKDARCSAAAAALQRTRTVISVAGGIAGGAVRVSDRVGDAAEDVKRAVATRDGRGSTARAYNQSARHATAMPGVVCWVEYMRWQLRVADRIQTSTLPPC
jgi:hypothetical protein